MDSTRIALKTMIDVITSPTITVDAKRSIYAMAAKVVPHRALGTDSNSRDTVTKIQNFLGETYDDLELLASIWFMMLPDEVFDGKRLYRDTAGIMLTRVSLMEPDPPTVDRLAADLEKWNVVLFLYYFHRAVLVGGNHAAKGSD